MWRPTSIIYRAGFIPIAARKRSAAEALIEYQRAVELDPTFALAWAGLAQTHVWDCGYSSEGRARLRRTSRSARDAVERALALEPNLPDALFAQAHRFKFRF